MYDDGVGVAFFGGGYAADSDLGRENSSGSGYGYGAGEQVAGL